MFKLIREFFEFKKMKHQRVMSCKRFVVTNAMIKFFEDLQQAKGSLELPPFICAHNAMKTIKTDRQLNKVYKDFKMAGLV